MTGTKTQTINVCTAAGQDGVYEFIVRLRPPFVEETHLRDQAFATVDDLVTFLRKNHRGEVQRAEIASAHTSLPKQPDEDRVSRLVATFRNHPVLALLIFVGLVVIALGAFTDALSSILRFVGVRQ